MPTTLIRATAGQYTPARYAVVRNCTANTTASSALIGTDTPVSPMPAFSFSRSAAVSPTVVRWNNVPELTVYFWITKVLWVVAWPRAHRTSRTSGMGTKCAVAPGSLRLWMGVHEGIGQRDPLAPV
ncbi:hypothetical protein AQJ11_29870 [Streptomyces corchorusii]|uniref:Uncharacterized protein n=1 Tax=Streptomyces corchorusii TaxID=1903 RepID=A0A117QCC8_STRCK|nr:hypothetical protein AQJ11_29870 [Streptomyces corchorusii]